jgi:hypothetical protein
VIPHTCPCCVLPACDANAVLGGGQGLAEASHLGWAYLVHVFCGTRLWHSDRGSSGVLH